MPVAKSLLFALLGLSAFPLAAQTAKGSWLMGGNAHIRYQIDGGRSHWNTDLNPSAGYFVGNNFALGLGVPLAFSFWKTRPSAYVGTFVNGQAVELTRTVNSEIGLTLLVRGYFGKGKFRPFLQAQPGFMRQASKVEYRTLPERRYSQSSLVVSGGPGLSYFITDHVGVEALLNAAYNEELPNFPPTSIGLYFGLQFYLPKK
ncbi:MAG: porin family protein [Cytophagales bacterium]|nr:porin family protein [Cytophagales bacterium]